MEGYVVETAVGIFVLDQNAKVLGKILFPKEPFKAAVEVKEIQEGRLSDPIIDALKTTGCSSFVFENELIARAAQAKGILQTTVRPSPIYEEFRNHLESEWDGREKWIKEQSLELPVLKTAAAYNEFARQVTLQIARAGVARAAAKRDLSAVQAVRAMDDIDKTLNLLAGRVREWFGLHFPEMDRLVERHDTYARLVTKLGNRRNFTYENLVSEGLPKDTAEKLAETARRSMGAEIEASDLVVLQSFCNLMLDLYKFREKSETYVDDVLKQVAPNMSAIVGASLSARLISIAGSLDNLAKMPASTLQVLGAEKALFRSLKTGARPPKHGVIFQHTAVHQSPRWQRGKIARTIAGKLSIAARIDCFGGDFLGEKLRDDVNKKIEEIKERYKTAPPPKKKDFGHKRQTS
jgi:nucleolar protein 56